MTQDEKIDLTMSVTFLAYKRAQCEASVSRTIYLAQNAKNKEESEKLFAESKRTMEIISELDKEFVRLSDILKQYSSETYKRLEAIAKTEKV